MGASSGSVARRRGGRACRRVVLRRAREGAPRRGRRCSPQARRGVVLSDEDAACADGCRCCEEAGADRSVDEEDGECDREGGACVIAWERGVMGAAAPDMGGQVGARVAGGPDLADRLVHQERQGRRAERDGGEFHFRLLPGRARSQSPQVVMATTGTPNFDRGEPAPSQACGRRTDRSRGRSDSPRSSRRRYCACRSPDRGSRRRRVADEHAAAVVHRLGISFEQQRQRREASTARAA